MNVIGEIVQLILKNRHHLILTSTTKLNKIFHFIFIFHKTIEHHTFRRLIVFLIVWDENRDLVR